MKERTLSIITMRKTFLCRYDLNIKAIMLTFEKTIMSGFRLSKSWWFGTDFHINIYLSFSMHLCKTDRFTRRF